MTATHLPFTSLLVVDDTVDDRVPSVVASAPVVSARLRVTDPGWLDHPPSATCATCADPACPPTWVDADDVALFACPQGRGRLLTAAAATLGDDLSRWQVADIVAVPGITYQQALDVVDAIR